MKFWSIITLLIFMNSVAFPGIARLMDIDVPTSSINITEEETHSSNFQLSEKALPETLDVHKFLKFFEAAVHKKQFLADNESHFIAPEISIISPPPEIL